MAVWNSLHGCLGGLFLICLLLILPGMSSASEPAYELLIGSGDEGTYSHFAVRSICRAIRQEHPDIVCRPVPSTRQADNLSHLLNGSLDLVLIDSKVIADAYMGTGVFQYISVDYDQLRLLLPVYRTPMTLLVRRDAKIAGLDDLPGKRVNIGLPGGRTNRLFHTVMAAAGWQEKTFSLLQTHPPEKSQDVIALQDGSVQALFHVGMHPDQNVEKALGRGRITLIGLDGQAVDRLIDANRGFHKTVVPGGTYPGQAEAVATLGLETLLLASAETDKDLVNRVLQALLQGKPQLQNAHPALLQETVDMTRLNASYLHPHPAAILYLQAHPQR